MSLRGSVKAFSLEQLLEFLNSSGHDGSLHVHHKDAQKTLYLYRSGLYLERSNWSFRLGDALVRAGAIQTQQLEEALTLQREGDRRLGDCLKELGFADDHMILNARRTQTEEEIYEVFSWESAFFEFEKDDLPKDFVERLKNPEEFRFEARSVLVEATRRRDEWVNIQNTLPSEKRIFVLASEEGSIKRATRELKEANARVTDPLVVFDGTRTLAELPHLLGLSSFDCRSLVTHLILAGDLRALMRHELESRFRLAIRSNMTYALRLYECALESPEFDQRGRFLDRVLFGAEGFKSAASEQGIEFTARLSGRRAFQMLLALFRQGIPCELSVREEGKSLRLALSSNALVWRVDEGQTPPSIVKHLLARSPVSATDLVRVRELQEETGRTLQQILVGGGYVTMENWFRAQKDTVLSELFSIFFLQRPYLEVRTREDRGSSNPGLDIEVPLLPWLHAEVMREIREWEKILTLIPSVRAYLEVTSKGEKSVQGKDDPTGFFNGQRSIEEAIKLQNKSPLEFLSAVYQRLQSGRLKQLDPAEYRERVEAALAAGQRADALKYCTAAIEADVEAESFTELLRELRAAESELAKQGERATLRGDLANFSLAEVLQTFHLRKASGTLRVEAQDHDHKLARQIYFDQGDVFLLAGDMQESISEEDLETGLVAAGLVTEDQLAEAAARQMKEEVYEMFIWEGAEFEWVADELPPEFYTSKANRKIRLNTVNFLLEAVRRIGEWEEVRRSIPSDELVLAFDSNAVKMRVVLEKGNEDLLLLADGRHAVSDLVRMSRTRRFKALRVLAELVDEGTLKVVDLDRIQEEDEDALFASAVPTSGVIEEGFVGQIQFVGTLQDLVGEGLSGVLRVTDGRRSKELALIEGQVYRTLPYNVSQRLSRVDGAAPRKLSPEAKRLAELEAQDLSALPDDLRGRTEMEMKMLRAAIAMEEEEQAQAPPAEEEEDLSGLSDFELQLRQMQKEQEEEERKKAENQAMAKQMAKDTARDFAECFSWRGTRFELLEGTLPPRLEGEERDGLRLDGETFFDAVAEAGERWVKVGELLPRDLAVAYTSLDAVERARELAEECPELADLVGEGHTAEDIARLSGERFQAMSWLARLFEEGLAEGVEPDDGEGGGEEDWDFSL
ncbi:MAG: DUF4388 domain-containing protein [Planctomycetota bacterium]